jgi:hypothetical protein
MSIKLVSTGGGSVTIQEPNTASDFTLSVPARTGTTVLQDGSNNLLMNSGYGSDAVAYGCRAWVNFNGTGTPAIRASGNVSSITDNGTGDYTINFTNALVDANYSVTGMCQSDANTGFPYNAYEGVVSIAKGRTSPLTTTGVRITTMFVAGPSYVDATQICVSVFR